jgi:energy-coupling factor transporter ATP-binding protein EcfA2
VIEIDHLSFRYPGTDRVALHDVSLNIADGEFVAVMGENGSGKSTLVRSLNGLLQPTEGSVAVDGWKTNDTSRLRSIREHTGVVFQNPHLQITSLTVERELAFGLQNIGVETEEMRVRVEAELMASGLSDARRRSPRNLSGGEQQRLALAAILTMTPRHLILDEATSLLSPSSRSALLEQVVEARRRRGMTLVLVTQFAGEALRADRLVILHHGRIALDGPPRKTLGACASAGISGIPIPTGVRPGDAI